MEHVSRCFSAILPVKSSHKFVCLTKRAHCVFPSSLRFSPPRMLTTGRLSRVASVPRVVISRPVEPIGSSSCGKLQQVETNVCLRKNSACSFLCINLGKAFDKGVFIGSNAGVTSAEFDLHVSCRGIAEWIFCIVLCVCTKEKVIVGASNDHSARVWGLNDQRLRVRNCAQSRFLSN